MKKLTLKLAALTGGALLFSGCAATQATSGKPAELSGDNNTFVCNGLIIERNLLEENEYNLRYKLPGPMPEVKYITIHNTANKAPASAERAYLNNRRDEVSISFHFAVDEEQAVQIMPLNIHGWHAGDGSSGSGNRESIGIEICRSTLYDGDLYPRSEENAVKLAAYLLFIEDLPVEALRMHQDWSGKKCPHRIIETNRWQEFKNRVQVSLEELKAAKNRQK